LSKKVIDIILALANLLLAPFYLNSRRWMRIVLGVSFDSMVHFVGETVHLQCGEASVVPVYWYHQLKFHDDSDSQRITITGDHLNDGDRGGRLRLNGTKLIMDNINTSDSGIYTCVNGATGREVKYQVRLDVDGIITCPS